MSTLPSVEVGANYSLPPDFNVLDQPLYFLLRNGTLAPPFSFDILDNELFYATQWCIVYGCTIGAAVMTLLHVVALTPLSKRRTLIFWLNVIGLCQVLVRGIVQSLYFTRDRFATFYVNLSGDSTTVPPLHRVHSTISVVLSLTSITTVEIIFFVQGRAILSALPRKLYLAMISSLVFFGLLAITIRLIYAVYNIQDIWVWNFVTYNTSNIPQWCEPTTLITYVITIGAWSFVWTCFIGRQIFLRWKMNIMRGKSFGAMNVLFLAGIQSMILPIFFLIMQFVPAKNSFQGAEYIVVPCVLCLMPFSCLWAGTISSANGQGCDEAASFARAKGRTSSSRLPFAKFFTSAKSESANTTARNLSGVTAIGLHNTEPKSPMSSNHLDKLYPELQDDDHIAVTQTFTVHSGHSDRQDSVV